MKITHLYDGCDIKQENVTKTARTGTCQACYYLNKMHMKKQKAGCMLFLVIRIMSKDETRQKKL